MTPAAPAPTNGFSHADGIPRPNAAGATPGQAGPTVLRPRWALFVLGFGVCTALGLCDAAEEYVSGGLQGVAVAWPSAIALGLGLWYLWGLVGLLVFALARRFPLGQRHWRRRLGLHLAAAVAFAALKITLDYPLIVLFYCPDSTHLPFGPYLAMAFASQFVPYLVVYWAVLLVAHALDYYGKYRERELRAAQLETGLARARLDLLKSQLQPHFLFNTLNAVSSLIHSDVEAADRMVARLGDLLRLSLEDFGLQEAPLARELEVIRSYLAIEQARLGPRLSVHLDIAPGAEDALAPTFLLQPLVENAIHHGVAPRRSPGRVEVRAWRERDRLHLEVRDDGPGLPPEPGGGVGLSNTRARLFHLYGAEQRLEVSNDPCGGCVARVTLPFRVYAGPAGDDRTGPDDPNADRG